MPILAGDSLKDKRELVVTGLRPLLEDRSTKVCCWCRIFPHHKITTKILTGDQFLSSQVRSTLAQIIIAMAHHDFLSLEGGHLLVKYIVEQCSITDVCG